MSRTDRWYALRGTTKVALICAAISAALFIMAGGDLPEPINMAPQAGIVSPIPLEPAVATPYDCQRLRNGQWLQVIVYQRNHKGWWHFNCYYGPVQIYAGDAYL